MFGARIVIHGMGQVTWPRKPGLSQLDRTEASDAFTHEESGAFEFEWVVNWRIAIY
jgi:hypothetical protein